MGNDSMTPEDCLKLGNLDEALRLLQDRIKKQPSNANDRVFLFQLLSVMGQWDRALTQLAVVKELDDSSIAMVLMYRQVIACEKIRERVFLGQEEPTVVGQPKQWIALMIQALRMAAEEQYEHSQVLRMQAFEEAPSVSGTLNDESFEWLADSDARIGPIMEAIIDGRYIWTSWENLQSVVIEAPIDLRDVIWLPVHFEWKNGGENYGLMPARYPRSYQMDPLLALSRKTVWQELPHDIHIGYGQKMLLTDRSEYPLMEARSITINAAPNNAEG